jgi:hypothetical protein
MTTTTATQTRTYLCEACGSTDPRPVTHKTWCSVRIADPRLHRFNRPADLTGAIR